MSIEAAFDATAQTGNRRLHQLISVSDTPKTEPFCDSGIVSEPASGVPTAVNSSSLKLASVTSTNCAANYHSTQR